jgi:Tfp pilus assembly protein PilE
MKRSMRQPQLGMTFIGILCILALVGVIAYAGIRLVPVYLNYMKVARTMEVTATEFKGENPDVGALRRTLEKHWIVEDPSAVDFKEIEITKNESGGVLMHLAYDDSVPYIANVSLSVHFDKTVKVQ